MTYQQSPVSIITLILQAITSSLLSWHYKPPVSIITAILQAGSGSVHQLDNYPYFYYLYNYECPINMRDVWEVCSSSMVCIEGQHTHSCKLDLIAIYCNNKVHTTTKYASLFCCVCIIFFFPVFFLRGRGGDLSRKVVNNAGWKDDQIATGLSMIRTMKCMSH